MDEKHWPLSLNYNTSTKEAHRLIDEAIQRHQASILALKYQRNAFNAPISHFPPEILCKIFSIVKQEGERHPTYKEGVRRIPLPWVSLTHVSRHWRNVGIDSPSLWTDPPIVGDLSWVERMLSRSKNSCLVLKKNYLDSSQFILGLKLALQHSQRVKELSLRFDSGRWQELQAVFPKTTPQLECLRLDCSLPESPARRPHPKPSLFGSEEVLCETPKLRSLDLNNVDLNWNTYSHLFHALTHLKLHNVCPNPQLTWKQFADVLKGMPNLEDLHLHDAFPADLDTSEQVSWDSTHFASLRNIFIHCHTNKAELFFSCLTFPATTIVSIECSVHSTTRADFSGVLMRLAQSYSNTLDNFQTLILFEPTLFMMPGIKFRLVVDALEDEQMFNWGTSFRVECMFTWTPSVSHRAIFTKAINDILDCALPLQNISRVYLSERIYGLEPDILANTIGKLSQVRSFVTTRSAARIFVDALRIGSLNEDGKISLPSGTLSFPVLSSICFHSARFRAKDCYEGPDDDTYHLPIELLRDCLNQRSRSGAGLAKLKFSVCRKLFNSDVDSFRNIVDVVDWDEEEDPDDSEDEDDDFGDEYGDEYDDGDDDSEDEDGWRLYANGVEEENEDSEDYSD